MVINQGFRVRLRMVRVGKTAIQIMRASWCLLGGPTGFWVGVADALDMVMFLFGGCCVGWGRAYFRPGPT
jgi:hypothetical protein